jgi:D-alanyl-D-alanine dipeptidase
MPDSTTRTEYAPRRRRLQESLGSHGLDAVLLCPSADLKYWLGDAVDTVVAEDNQVNDRPPLAVVTSDSVRVAAPLLEAVEYPETPPDVRLVTWKDGQDLIRVVVDGLPAGTRIGVADDVPYWLVDRVQGHTELRVTTAGPILHELRAVKTDAEMELMRAASAAADATYVELQSAPLRGLRESEVSHKIATLLEKHGCDAGSGGALVASGPNAASPHHAAGDRVLQENDVVIIGFGGSVNGYNSDTSRTFVLGEPSPELARIHALVLEANQAAFAGVRPGVRIEEIDALARRVIDDAGYGEYFLHRTGHGIGVQVHEHPFVVAGDTTTLLPGMTFTIEPGIYVEGVGGVRIEDVVVVTENGGESLNATSRDLARLS